MEFDLTGQQIGPYRILKYIGRGGMAWVYRARHTLMNWDVALKVLDPTLTSEADFVARFTHEAQWLNQMQHPNIVRVVDAAMHERYFYIALEYLEGESLDSVLDRVQRLPPEQAIGISIQVAEALAYAHTRFRVIHRDIKPGNIFLLRNGAIKVLDFGVAAMLGQRQTAKTRIGTPEYMPYEQYQGQADERSDIYGLGATLYHSVTGKLPTPYGIDLPVPPRQLNPRISPQLEQIILCAMQRDPRARFQSAAQMAQALRALGVSQPTSAFVQPAPSTRPVPPLPNRSTLQRRSTQPVQHVNPAALLLGGGGILALFMMLIVAAASSPGSRPLPTRIGNLPDRATLIGALVPNQTRVTPTLTPHPIVTTAAPVVITVPPIVITSPPIVMTVPPVVITTTPNNPQRLDVTPVICADTSPYGLSSSQMPRLGCPAQGWVASRKVVIQQFARGVMVIFAKPGNVFDNQGGGSIYALANDGRAWRIVDTYIESSANPADWYACNVRSSDGPEVTGVPWRGFGRAWCEHAEVSAALGRAVSAEQGDITASFQSYERGRAFQVSDWRGFAGWNTRRVYSVYLESVDQDFVTGVWEQQ